MDAYESTRALRKSAPEKVKTHVLAPAQRLRRPREFKRAFARGTRSRCGPFLAVAAPHGSDGALSMPRLGLAIAKRHAPKAVERNRIKRQLREDFRKRSADLPLVDCVICLRAPTRSIANVEIRAALNELWQRVKKKCDTSSFS